MGTFIKNFLHILKRYKPASFLNVTGLSIAFAASLIIMMQIEYEWTFDRFHPKADCLYRIDMPRSSEDDQFASILTRGFVDKVLASSPHIKAGTFLCPFMEKSYATVREGPSQKGFIEDFATCYPDIVNTFGFTITEGNRDCLKNPEMILIPASMAKRMFGNETAVGKMLWAKDQVWTKSDVVTFTVGGVYEDFPENTQLNNCIYTCIDKTFENDWDFMNFLGYILLDDRSSKEEVEITVNTHIDFKSYGKPEETRIELVPITDIYFRPEQLSDLFKVGNPNTTNLLLLVAFLVIAIACINFINFSTALAPLRMKSINTQSILFILI